MPSFSASLMIRTASMTIPAEFGESQTSSFISMLSGTSPNERPSRRMCAHLRLDVVADDRQAIAAEPLLPVVLASDEHRQAVHEADACLDRHLHVPLRRLLGADRQVADHDVGLLLLEDADDVGGRAGRLRDLLLQVLAEAVMGHPTVNLDAEVRHVGELDRVVLTRPHRLREILADLLGIDVERGDELDVANVVSGEVDVHQPRHPLRRVGVAVVGDALDERVGAVADADDGDANLAVVDAVSVGRRLFRGLSVGRHRVEDPPLGGTKRGRSVYMPRLGRCYTASARRSAARTCRTRCTAVIAVRPATAKTAGARSSKSPRLAPLAKTRP